MLELEKGRTAAWGRHQLCRQSPPSLPAIRLLPREVCLSCPWVSLSTLWVLGGRTSTNPRASPVSPVLDVVLVGSPNRHVLVPAWFFSIMWGKARCTLTAQAGSCVLKSWSAFHLFF